MERIFEKNTEGKFLYIRHGETTKNKRMEVIDKNKLKAIPEYLDCELDKKGIEQAKKASEIISNFEIEDIWVSPLHRTLQTAFYLFENNPNRDKLVLKVNPFIIEAMSGTDTLSFLISKRKKEFNMNSKVKFDWSYFDSIYTNQKDQDLFYLDFIDKIPEEDKNKLINDIKDNYYVSEDKLRESILNLCYYITNHNIDRIETLLHVFNRNLKFKEFLSKKYNNRDPNKKIIIITHSRFISISTSKKIYSMNEVNDYPDDTYCPKNCEIISINNI